MANAYGMPDRDGAPAPKLKDKGTAEDGLSMIENIRGDVRAIEEQARWSAGARNESLPGGFKLTQ